MIYQWWIEGEGTAPGNFMRVFEKIGRIVGWRPLLEGWRPVLQ